MEGEDAICRVQRVTLISVCRVMHYAIKCSERNRQGYSELKGSVCNE